MTNTSNGRQRIQMALWLNGIFKDGMVLQRDKEIRVFGTTDPGPENKVTVTLKKGNKNISKGICTDIYDDGFFIATLPGVKAGGPFDLIVTTKTGDKLKIQDVWSGEVWVACGQGNMSYPLKRSEGARKAVESCPDTNIRFYNIPAFGNYTEEQMIAEIESEWISINKDTCGDMSAIAFYFGRKLEKYLNDDADYQNTAEGDTHLKIGIIGCYMDGTSIASWQSMESLYNTVEGRRYLEEYAELTRYKSDEECELEEKAFREAQEEHESKAQRYLSGNPYLSYFDIDSLVGPAPWPPPVSRTSDRRPGALFDTMVLRIVPYSMKGVVFYQGENDADEHADDYAAVMRTMIEEWRESFWDEDLPFVFCQLPMYISKERKYMGYDDMKWPKLRLSQEKVARTVPGTYMAVLSDCGEFDNVHPTDKKTPGDRLAQLALRFVYGFETLPAISPYVIDVRRGDGVEISFEGDFSMLNIQSPFSSEESGFEIAGTDGEFHPAEATVDFDGRTVLLNCPQVEYAIKVRYAYFSYGSASLIADTGLAAIPFTITIGNTIGEFY